MGSYRSKKGVRKMTDNILIDIFNMIYTKYGFDEVIKEVEDRLEYGTVKKMNGLIRISTGGHSDDEDICHALTHILCRFNKHYCGYTRGGAFYFCEEKYATVEMVRVINHD